MYAGLSASLTRLPGSEIFVLPGRTTSFTVEPKKGFCGQVLSPIEILIVWECVSIKFSLRMHQHIFCGSALWSKNIARIVKKLPREHLIGCQGVKIFLLKYPFWVLSQFEFLFGHNLSFVIFWVLSQFQFCYNLSFVTTWLFRFFHKLSFEFCHHLSSWGL